MRVNNYRYDKSYSVGALEEFATSFIRKLIRTTKGTKKPLKKWSNATSNFIALIPSRSIRQILAIFPAFSTLVLTLLTPRVSSGKLCAGVVKIWLFGPHSACYFIQPKLSASSISTSLQSFVLLSFSFWNQSRTILFQSSPELFLPDRHAQKSSGVEIGFPGAGF